MDCENKIALESHEIELLKIFYDEWKYRHTGLWKRITQFFVIIFFVSTLPVTVTFFNGTELPEISMYVFPAFGILLSVLFLVFCLCESYRINAISHRIDLITGKLPEPYKKSGLKQFSHNDKDAPRFFRWRMVIWVPMALFIIELIISFAMIVIISQGLLPDR